MSSALKEFQVRGWLRGATERVSAEGMKPVYVERPRVALSRVETIRALSPVEAAKQYARSHQIRESLWNDATPRPFCVIRVSDAGAPTP